MRQSELLAAVWDRLIKRWPVISGVTGGVSLAGWSLLLRRRLTLHSDQVTINDERATRTEIDEAAAELAELAVTRIDAAAG